MGQIVERSLPRSWVTSRTSPALIETQKGFIEILPLAHEGYNGMDGWCTSGWMLSDSPEVEIMCGGVNTKRPSHAGIWRQGNLLHFGFEPGPSELNDNGRALLVNSIAYISRFTEDVPLTKTPSVFSRDEYFRTRSAVDELMEGFSASQLANLFAPDLLVGEMDSDTFGLWYKEWYPYLHANEWGLLDVDLEVKDLGTSFDDPAFIETAISALDEGQKKKRLALKLLARYVDGPLVSDPSRDAWANWYAENGEFLFFTETSGFKWYVDTLAKDRGVPTRELRGPARATLPLPVYR